MGVALTTGLGHLMVRSVSELSKLTFFFIFYLLLHPQLQSVGFEVKRVNFVVSDVGH